MKSHFFLIVFLFIVSSKICIAQVEPFGLQGQTITSLSAVPLDWPNPWELNICAGTNGNGVFVRDFSSPDTNWISLGLSGRIITAVTIQHWGSGPGEFNTAYAGVQPDYILGDSTILYKRELFPGLDTTWTPADSGLILNPDSFVQSLQSFHYQGHDPPLPIFLIHSFDVYWFSIFQSEWLLSLSNNQWQILATSQIYFWGWDVIWVGGKTPNAETVLAKSLSHGNSWEFFLLTAFENNCTAIGIDPIDFDIVYVALEGELLKTTNGGEDWFATGLLNPNATFTGIVVNPSNTEHLLVGGATGENNFILYESNNGGSNWHEILPDSLLPGISGMVADTFNNEFSVYIGTLGNGVYLYKTPITSIDEESNELVPDQFRLYQNYPNPFNPTTKIRYSVPSVGSGDRVFVQLKVYDVLGNEVATLVNEELPAGEYEVEFDGTGLPSGIYFYRLQANEYVETKKMVLLR